MQWSGIATSDFQRIETPRIRVQMLFGPLGPPSKMLLIGDLSHDTRLGLLLLGNFT